MTFYASRWAKAVAFIILVLVELYSAHFTARIKIANEHVAFSRAALRCHSPVRWANS